MLPGISSSFEQMNTCIGRLEEMFRTRMIVHEEEIIQIAHSELKKIQIESNRVIQQYSQLIEQKNLS
jgi:peptidoglycan hydrolase CwlO-like protein